MSSSAIRAGRAFVELFLDRTELEKGLKAAQQRLKTFGASVTSVGKTAFGLGASIAGAFIPTITAAADAQAAMAKFEAVFGDQAAAAEKFAGDIATSIGRSKVEILGALSTYQSFFRGLKFGGQESREMSEQLQALALDFAAFHDISDQEAMERFISALSGSSEVLDRFGVNTKQAALEEELLAKGINKAWTEVTEQEKAVARLSIIMKSMQQQGAIGQAARESGEWSSQLKALKGLLQEAAIKIGNELLPRVLTLVSSVREFINEALVPWIDRNRALIPVIAELAAGVAATGAGLIVFGQAVTATSAVIGAFNTVTKAAAANTVAFQAGLLGLGAIAGIIGYQLNPAIAEFNRQMGIALGLSGKLAALGDRDFQNFRNDVAMLSTGEKKRAAIEAKIAESERELKALEQQKKNAAADVDRNKTSWLFPDKEPFFGTGIREWTGDKVLREARQHFDVTSDRVDHMRERLGLLRDMLQEIDRHQQALAKSEDSPFKRLNKDPAFPFLGGLLQQSDLDAAVKAQMEANRLWDLQANQRLEHFAGLGKNVQAIDKAFTSNVFASGDARQFGPGEPSKTEELLQQANTKLDQVNSAIDRFRSQVENGLLFS